MGKRSEQIFLKGDIEVDNRYMNRYQTSLMNRNTHTEKQLTHVKNGCYQN